jgi:O-antigen/teichoic acid export membrane protein
MNNYIFLSGGALYYGYYAIAVVIQNTLSIIPVSVSQVIYPRMSIMYGEGQKVKNILKENVKPLFTQFFLLLAFSILGYFLLPFFVELLLPEYINGIGAAQWTIFIPLVMSLGALNNIYNVVGRQKYYLFSLVSGAVIGSLYVVITVTINGFSLETFPQGMLIGKFCQQLLGLSLLRKVIN